VFSVTPRGAHRYALRIAAQWFGGLHAWLNPLTAIGFQGDAMQAAARLTEIRDRCMKPVLENGLVQLTLLFMTNEERLTNEQLWRQHCSCPQSVFSFRFVG
jgi:hypothetical protein